MGLPQVELFFIAIVICQLSVVMGQFPDLFVYGNEWHNSWTVPDLPNTVPTPIDNSNVTCLGDFQQVNFSLNISGSGTANVSGSCLYRQPLQLIQTQPYASNGVNPFGTMFQVTISSSMGRRELANSCSSTLQSELAFIMIATDNSTLGDHEAGDYLGWLNSTTSKGHYFAVKLYFDPQDNFYIGVDQNGASLNASKVELPDDPLTGLNVADQLILGISVTLAVWVQYNGSAQILEVFIALPEAGSTLGEFSDVGHYRKPTRPIIATTVSLIDIFSGFSAFGLSGMYVGFSGSISVPTSGMLFSDIQYSIRQWTFNSDGLAPDVPRNSDGSLLVKLKQNRIKLIAAVASIGAFVGLMFVVFLIVYLYGRNTRLTALAKKYEIDIDRDGRNFKYKALSAATKGFNSSELLGTGGFGPVYKGRILLKGDEKPIEVAVKRISATSNQGENEFLAEVKIIGQAQHRNLVRLLGWCREKGDLLLVYDYMPNGSVDQHLFKDTDDASGVTTLTWSRRLKIVSGVAAALTYLHEEWDKRVIHRDVKCSNIMLDSDFNARLGDFGLARLYEHGKSTPITTKLAGTYGYMAPELFQTLTATEKTDVYSFGAVVLEVATGKKPIFVKDEGTSDQVLLVDWVWDLYDKNALLDAADRRLENAYDKGEMIMLLKIGLLCSHPDPNERPSMREVVNIWKGLISFPPVPRSKPIPTYALAMHAQAGLDSSLLDSDSHSAITVCSLGDSDSITTQKPKEESGYPNPSLRYRPRTTPSLPF